MTVRKVKRIWRANNVRARIPNTGGLFYRGQPSVYEVPRFSGTNAIFAGSIWIGGLVDGSLRVAAARYTQTEMWAGPIDDSGNPPENCNEYDHVYSVRRIDIGDYEASGLITEDLRLWPTGLGAPTLDANGNQIDLMSQLLSNRVSRRINLAAGERPAIRGDQSIWWVMNDRGNEHKSTDTPPLGIEVHGHAFAAYYPTSAINNATLYHYRIFNKNAVPITEAYVGVFLNVDLGDFDDDYIGADTSRGMGFVYNGDNFDDNQWGYGTAPPALGSMFLQGPVADSDLKDNDGDGLVDEQGERLRTTTIGYWQGGGGYDTGPTSGEQYYQYLMGEWRDGRHFTFGGDARNFSSTPTNFVFPGDPVTREFWSEMNVDGLGTPNEPGDRIFFISSGPFSIDPGENTDFTFAIVWARGRDHLDSVIELRKAADHVRSAFELGAWDNPILIPEDPVPAAPNLSAALADNFPEPFSEKTTIRYRVPHLADVHLVVLDVLGREVTVLVSEPQGVGDYSISFNGTDLPSGVYFYRIEIGHASATRSMMLVK
ncbi:MAG: T9SS type A sorting domain-containing protein [Bacteroidetes bacterium]|nr:T9SS type A sorting domain-containing protein [Bacteroidota bacterium]